MPNLDQLILCGFRKAGHWEIEETTRKIKFHPENQSILKITNAIYAFVLDDTVQYIGKSIRPLGQRFSGYRNPNSGPNGTRTNTRISQAIINSKRTWDIYVCHIINEELPYGAIRNNLLTLPRFPSLPINLAEGLELAFINKFNPPNQGR